MGMRGLDSSGSGYGQVASCSEHGNQSSDSLKGRGDFLAIPVSRGFCSVKSVISLIS
jgi:hypothetical protein